MTKSKGPSVDDPAVNLYDGFDSAQFYKIVMADGCHDVHYGVYEKPTDTTAQASANTVTTLLRLAKSAGVKFDATTRVLDEGAGNGGPAHRVASMTGAHVTCLNLCANQNAVNKKRVAELGMQDKIDIRLGTFENLPAEWTDKFDVIWSQDAYDHSSHKETVIAQAFRVLKPGGHMVFMDIMASPMASTEDLAFIKARLHLEQMYTLDDYERELAAAGFKVLRTRDMTCQLVTNYRRMRDRLISKRDSLTECSDAFITKYKDNLQKNVDILMERSAQTWYSFVAQKPNTSVTNSNDTGGKPMVKRFVGSKLHNIGVTHKNVNYHGSAGICKKLMKEVGIQPYEVVEIANCRNGMRWTTYAIPEEDEGSFKMNGAAGRLGEIGDECILFTLVSCEEFVPAKVIVMDPLNNNKIIDRFMYTQDGF